MANIHLRTCRNVMLCNKHFQQMLLAIKIRSDVKLDVDLGMVTCAFINVPSEILLCFFIKLLRVQKILNFILVS